MKKMYLFLLVFTLVSVAHGQEKTELRKEKEAIMTVILEETQSFCDKDFERYAACYKHDESIVDLRANSINYYRVDGWETNSMGMREFMHNNPEPFKNMEVKKNFYIQVYPDCAWAIFDNEIYDEEGKLADVDIGVNFLEKIDGDWKIVYLSRVGASSYSGDFEEMEMSEELLKKYVGRYLLGTGSIIVITLEEGQLFGRIVGQHKRHLFPYEENKFFLKMINAQVEFNSEEDKVVGLILHQNGEMNAIKIE